MPSSDYKALLPGILALSTQERRDLITQALQPSDATALHSWFSRQSAEDQVHIARAFFPGPRPLEQEFGSYNLQIFQDTARRRLKEAQHLLHDDLSLRSFDGAVVCALLATECALKALLLHGYDCNKPTDEGLPPAVQSLFRSKDGHNIALLWQRQPSRVQTNSTPETGIAIVQLHQKDRFQHRYGAKRPGRSDADCVVASARCVIDWMVGFIA